jgi:hypothetical protein
MGQSERLDILRRTGNARTNVSKRVGQRRGRQRLDAALLMQTSNLDCLLGQTSGLVGTAGKPVSRCASANQASSLA